MLGSRPVAATLMGSVPPSSPPIAYPIASPGQLGDAACPIIIEPDEVDMELQHGPNEVEPKTGHVGLGIEETPSPAPAPNSEANEKDAGGKARNSALAVELPPRDAGRGSASPTTPPLPSLSVDMPTPEVSPTSSIGTASTCTTAPVSPVTPTMANTPMVTANTATVAGQSQPLRRNSLASKKLTAGLAPPPSLAGQKRRRSAPSTVSMYEQLLSGSGGSLQGKASSANQAGASGKDMFAGPNKRLKRSVRFKSDEDLVETRLYELQPGEVEDKRIAAGSRVDGQQDPEERWKALKIDREKKVDRDKLLEEELEDERLEKQEEEEATVAAEEQEKFEHEMKRGVATRCGQKQTIPWYPPRKVWLSDAQLFMLAEPGSESTDRALAEEAGFPSSFPSLPDNGDESLGDVVEEEPTEALSTVDFLPSNLRRDTYTLFDPFEPFGQEELPPPQQQQQQAEHDFLHQVPAPYQPEAQVWQQQGGNALHFPPPVYHTTAQRQQHETYYPQWPSVGNEFSQVYDHAVPMSQPWQGSSAYHVSVQPPHFLPAPKGMPGPTPNQQQGGSKWPSTAAQQRSPQASYRPVAAGGSVPSSSESSRPWYPSGPPRPPSTLQPSSKNTFSAAPRKTGSNKADLGAQNRFTMRQQQHNNSQQHSTYQPQQRPMPRPLAPASSASHAQRPGQGAGKRVGKKKSDKICFFFNGPKGCIKDDCPFRHERH
ncbi:hypothetical protein FA10DRAFT_268168 [Acaromyces ingoldii]|uniref:C3H1-type domain-containing protein n=1 Tax=Acaromyces ingoldii TaxID=215250 RepID=A0A316YJC7_9BASI|nr:hypothetical protein FA10DRAFT_268168 [Acaromyces ingoldii]PWN89640.1 hypothetical protein FA10DRAFT_268168 [Acaromyces ingoldii]